MDDIGKKTRAHVFIKGKVQGVYFRQNTKQVATKHKVNGWVRNLLDGRVEAIFEGDNIDVNKVMEWCHVGPPNSIVDDVEVRFEKYTGEFAGFTIKNN
ncbi:MAG: acylphosphatase [Thermoproteota archaeon]|nr:acylphosphatase [Thermoproteota archaeon]